MRRLSHAARHILSCCLVSMLICTLAPVAAAAPADTSSELSAAPVPAVSDLMPFDVSAEAAYLLDFRSGAVLFAKNEEQQLAPASLVKIMTLFLAWDAVAAGKVNLGDTVTIGPNAYSNLPEFQGGSLMFLEPGMTVKFEDLLKGIAVVSGNEATVAVAEHLAGSVDLFVKQMNEKAAELGMTGTTFRNTHGLAADGQLTTAKDMAILSRAYIATHPQALEVHSMRSFTVRDRLMGEITQSNRNGLLGRVPGVDGLKTGHLGEVGYNLIATGKEGEMRLIAVILGSDSVRDREAAATQLLQYGWRNFENVEVAKQGEPIWNVPVYKGRARKLSVGLAGTRFITVEKGKAATTSVNLPTYVVAPIDKGEQVGELIVTVGTEEVQRLPLVAENEVPLGGVVRRLWDGLRLFFRGLLNR